MYKSWFLFWIVLLFSSCDFFKKEVNSTAIARVKDSYLYKEELNNLVPKGTSKQDSLQIVRSFIDRWASQKLLINAAELNIDSEDKAAFDELIKQYKIDLYTKAYIEKVVKKTLDTIISEQDLEAYYKNNKENFKTNGTLVRLRYINLSKDNPKFQSIKSKFLDFKKSDKKFWDTYALQCKSFALNDSIWVDLSSIYDKLPFINPDNRDQYIASGKTIQHSDSLDVYLVKIRQIIDKNQIAPFDYLKPTLKEVILNKRKLELIKKFEKEITDDAIKDKDYEIYK
jgi:hypothetical protein